MGVYVVGSKSFRPDQLLKVTEIKQICYFSTQSPFISTHFSTDTLTSPQMALYIPHSVFYLAWLLFVRPERFGPYYVLRGSIFTQYVVGSKIFRPDQLFKVTEIKQLCYFSTQSPFISTHFSTDTLISPQMALYIPHSIFHLAWLLYVRPETLGPYYV